MQHKDLSIHIANGGATPQIKKQFDINPMVSKQDLLMLLNFSEGIVSP